MLNTKQTMNILIDIPIKWHLNLFCTFFVSQVKVKMTKNSKENYDKRILKGLVAYLTSQARIQYSIFRLNEIVLSAFLRHNKQCEETKSVYKHHTFR